MVTIVLGVGATRGWRSTLLGVLAGVALLAGVVAVMGVAAAAIPIGPLPVLVGTLLLLFGLQWFRKGIARVAANGLAGYFAHEGACCLPSPPSFLAVGASSPDSGIVRWTGGEAAVTGFELSEKGVWDLLASAHTEPAGAVEASVEAGFRQLMRELHTATHVYIGLQGRAPQLR